MRMLRNVCAAGLASVGLLLLLWSTMDAGQYLRVAYRLFTWRG